VLETLEAYINEEIFARQPPDKFTARVPRKLLTKHQALFLEYRSKALYGAPNVLPCIVRKTADFFMDIGCDTSDSARIEHIKKISSTMTSGSLDIVTLLIAPTPRMLKDYAQSTHLGFALQIAILQQRADCVTALLAKGASPWKEDGHLGRSLGLAVRGEDVQILDRILSKATKDDGGRSLRVRSDIVNATISLSLRLQKSTPAIRLLHWRINNLDIPSASQRDYMFYTAVKANAVPFLEKLINLGLTPSLKEKYVKSLIGGFKTSKQANDILRLCYAKKVVDEWTRYREYPWTEAYTLLEWAIEADSIDLVKTVISHQPYASPKSSDLRKAIKRNKFSIVKFLLKRGYDPEGGDGPMDGSTMDLARKNSAVYHRLEKAILQKIAREKDEYKAPQRLVWNEKKQRDELIAYSFTAPKL